MKKLTPVQETLLEKVKLYAGTNPIPYDNLKNLCEVKSFESSFNALLFKGYVQHHRTNDNSNQFKLV